MNKIEVKIKKLSSDAKVPIYSTEGSAGADIYAIEDEKIAPNETKMIPTGIAMEIPENVFYQVWDRSGMGKKGIHRFAGIADPDYRGELKIILFNSTNKTYEIKKGDRIAQIIFLPVFKAEFEEVEDLNETERGEGGFNSTGR